jgi:hypothetical protein
VSNFRKASASRKISPGAASGATQAYGPSQEPSAQKNILAHHKSDIANLAGTNERGSQYLRLWIAPFFVSRELLRRK